jgi:signal transduction histidine kinase
MVMIALGGGLLAEDAQPPAEMTVTNASQLRQLAAHEELSCYPVRLEGLILWVADTHDRFILQDDSGAMAINLDLRNELPLKVGERVRFTTTCLVGQDQAASTALVDNDGIHSLTEKSGTLFLFKGHQPLHLEWFNFRGQYGLNAEWQGPGLPRQPISPHSLFRTGNDSAGPGGLRLPGLNYRCYEGQWTQLPDFSALPVTKQGWVTGFDLNARTKTEGVGLVFDGWIEVPRDGRYIFWTKSDDGSKLFIGCLPVKLDVLEPPPLPGKLSSHVSHSALNQAISLEHSFQWTEVDGTVSFISDLAGVMTLELSSGQGHLQVEVPHASFGSLSQLEGCQIRAVGILEPNSFAAKSPRFSLLVPNTNQITILVNAKSTLITADTLIRRLSPTNDALEARPLITNALQAKSLSQAEARRGYPVKIRGVITAQMGSGFTIQDSTWSIFFALDGSYASRMPKIGEYWEIIGKTTAAFAPNITVASASYLGKGIMPEPLRPAGDELINGSLDTQYIELQGVASDVRTNGLVLLTRTGKIKLQLHDLDPQMIKGVDGADVRIRGVITPEWNSSLQIVLANLRLFNASITMDEPAPARPFEIPLKHVSDLLLFDSHASALQRIRIAGQIIHSRHGEYFLMDGPMGIRFQTKTPEDLRNGSLVEIVGFPDFSRSFPTLRDCLVRQTGRAEFPPAQLLSGGSILNERFDATLVRIQATLVDSSVNSFEQMLELQIGHRGFTARIERENGLLTGLLPGSRLDLTGVYVGEGGSWVSSRDVDSFELLLNSPADVRLLARPSWWTVRHTLITLGGMTLAIVIASAWVIILRRQVEERTRSLAAEIQRREQAEYQRSLEMERARIAQDLHDDLGATLTQIGFLSGVEIVDASAPKLTRARLKEVSEKSLQMVTSLDEIVWAINPENDSLRSLATYLQHMVEDFFRTTTINCRFDVDRSFPVLPLTSEVRHNLYHTVREALNNSAKHSKATELWLRIHWRQKNLQIIIEDDGCGFTAPKNGGGGNGLTNMHLRMKKIGGGFEYETQPNRGTVCRINLPLE